MFKKNRLAVMLLLIAFACSFCLSACGTSTNTGTGDHTSPTAMATPTPTIPSVLSFCSQWTELASSHKPLTNSNGTSTIGYVAWGKCDGNPRFYVNASGGNGIDIQVLIVDANKNVLQNMDSNLSEFSLKVSSDVKHAKATVSASGIQTVTTDANF